MANMTAAFPNIMLLSAGRRVSLARALNKVAHQHQADLITADANPLLSAACQDNRMFIRLPHVDDDGYEDVLRNECKKHRVGLVIPTIDTELSKLSKVAESFRADGIEIIVSDENFIKACRDKRRTADYFDQFGVRSPEIFPLDRPRFPAIAKPYDGSLSKNVHIVATAEDYTENVKRTPNLMLARYLDHSAHEEYTCDAYYDKSGTLKCVVPRLRIEVRGGEVAKGKTVRNNIVDLFEKHLPRLPGARGCLTFQFFRHNVSADLWLIELNPRFGGGFPLTLAAGADYPQWLYNEYVLGQEVSYQNTWEANLTMLRFDGEILVSAGTAQ